MEFQVYATSPDTDLAKASGYRTADVKGDGTLSLTATGSAVLVQDQAGEITAWCFRIQMWRVCCGCPIKWHTAASAGSSK